MDDDYSNIVSNDTSIILEEEENDDTIINLTQKIEKVGKKKDKVWDYFNVVNIPNNSHKGAVCKFCGQSWKRGKPNDMKSHLALRCPNVNYSIKIEYLHMISSEDISDNEQLTQQQLKNKNNNRDVIDITRANKALVRFFVCCGIPFSIVDSPFFQDFVKSLCFEYNPPKRTTLSTNLLNTEAANITLKIEEELHQSKNLTLG